MPEGPEVEAARKLVARNLLNRKIVRAVVADDPKVFMERTPVDVQQALEGRAITAARRKAKYLWLELDGKGPKPLLHFGMTGSVQVQGVSAAQYKRVKPDESAWPPKFCKLELEFEGGAAMAFSDPRRFGRVQLLDDPANQEPVSKLGFDVIDELPDVEHFSQRLSAYQKPGSTLRIKALLLDQSFTAGVGNWVADEVLYQARVHPEQPVADMLPAQVTAIHAALKHVMQVAVDADADDALFPKDWLFHYRWTGKKASSVNGHAVQFVTVGSRTSAFVPALQKLVAGTGLSKQKAQRKAVKTKAVVVEETSIEAGVGVDVPVVVVASKTRKRARKSQETKATVDEGTGSASQDAGEGAAEGAEAAGLATASKDGEDIGAEATAQMPGRKGRRAGGSSRRKGNTKASVTVEAEAVVAVTEAVQEDGVVATAVMVTKRRKTTKKELPAAATVKATGARRTRQNKLVGS